MEKIHDKYKKGYCDFYNELRLEQLINKHNNVHKETEFRNAHFYSKNELSYNWEPYEPNIHEKSVGRNEIKEYLLKFNKDELITNYKVKVKDILETLEKITESSIYTYEKQISQGFITLPGGHRVGIVGNAITDKSEVVNISFISGMNFRVAHQVKNCGNFVLEKIYSKGEFQNTLIVGSPGSGKTTLLRDLIRQISDGNIFSKGLNVCVVDERNEIASMYKGQEQTDLGIRTDVMAGIAKSIGIKLLIEGLIK